MQTKYAKWERTRQKLLLLVGHGCINWVDRKYLHSVNFPHPSHLRHSAAREMRKLLHIQCLWPILQRLRLPPPLEVKQSHWTITTYRHWLYYLCRYLCRWQKTNLIKQLLVPEYFCSVSWSAVTTALQKWHISHAYCSHPGHCQENGTCPRWGFSKRVNYNEKRTKYYR